MLKALYQIDLFGKPVLFNYRGNSKSKSKVGAICTLILCGFIIWVTVYFGQQLLDTSNPKAGSFESFNDNPSATPLSIDNFAFAIGMAHPVTYANYINNSIFTISATTYKTTRVPQADGTVRIDYDIVPLEMESCRPDHFGELSETFSYIALDQLYCLKKEQPNLNNGQPILEGNWESPIFQGVFIDFLECDRNVSTNCGTQDEIDYLLKGGLLTLVFSNVAVDMTDAKKPLKKFRDGWYTSVGNQYNKEINVYLEQLQINTDKGWLTTEFQTEKDIKFGEIREMFSLVKKSNYVHFVIRLSNVMKHFNRSYTKIQDIIAQVNGTVLVTFTILIIILAPYVRLKFYETLINDIFDIKMSKKNQKGNKATKKDSKNEKNSKDEDEKIKHKLTINNRVLSSNEDLEVQKSPSDLISTNRLGLMEGRDTDDYNLLRGGVTLESCPTKPNFTTPIQRQSSKVKKANRYLKDDRIDDSKLKLSFSQSRGISGIPLNISEVQPETRREDNCDLTIPVLSARDSKPSERLLTPRKPNFVQPNLKILDYEEHGQEMLEDILKNMERDDNDPLGDLAMTQIRSDEREREDPDPQDPKLTKDNNKDDLSQMLRSNDDEEKEKAKPGHEREIINGRNQPTSVSLQKLDLMTSKKSGQINLSFAEYLRSFISKSDTIKNKMAILNEGINRINERLDIFNVFKKLREFDKLKVLLLENEQFVLFHSLPRPELALKEKESVDPHAPTNIKDPQFIQDKLRKDLILHSYQNIKQKKRVTMLDTKLLEIYDDILCINSQTGK